MNNSLAHQYQPRSHQAGVSLVEILIGTVLSLFLIGGLLQIANSTQNNNKLAGAMTELQENGRFALDEVVSALRYRGFQGCLTSKDELDTTGSNDENTAVFVNHASGLNVPSMNIGHLRGYDVSPTGTWAPALTGDDPDLAALQTTVDPAPRPGSDIVSLTYAKKWYPNRKFRIKK